MERLWSPWRSRYVTAASATDDVACIFCDHLASTDDAEALILHRGARAFALLNAFPYNAGHLMVAPIRHAGDLSDLDPSERADVMELVTRSIEVVRAAMTPDGFNAGINLGRVAGAGVPGHVHVHVVPRWNGDTNFMPVTAETKVLPESLEDTFAKLRPGFDALT